MSRRPHGLSPSDMAIATGTADEVRASMGLGPLPDGQGKGNALVSPAEQERARIANEPKKKSIINTATRGDEDKQRIATPWAVIHALEYRFGTVVDFDLAAEKDNAKARVWFGAQTDGSYIDSLTQDWSSLVAIENRTSRLAFLNPPFAHIKPWARKVAECRWLPRWTVMLVPASYSTDWFLELDQEVQRCAIPRIQFESQDKVYPKDLCLIIAGFGMVGDGYWDWRMSYLQWCSDMGLDPTPIHAKGCSALLKSGRVNNYFPDYSCTIDPFHKLAP